MSIGSGILPSSMLTSQAMIALVSYLVVAVVIIMPFNIDDPAVTSKYNFGNRLMLILLMFVPVGFSIYSIQCMSDSSTAFCGVWAYVNAIVIAIWVLLFLIATVVSIGGKKHTPASSPMSSMSSMSSFPSHASSATNAANMSNTSMVSSSSYTGTY